MLSAGTRPEHVDVLHPATLDLRGIGAGRTHFEVDLFDPAAKEDGIMRNQKNQSCTIIFKI